MQWGSVENFLSMGGYGFYVWGSYLMCVIALAVEVTMLRARGRRARAQAGALSARTGA